MSARSSKTSNKISSGVSSPKLHCQHSLALPIKCFEELKADLENPISTGFARSELSPCRVAGEDLAPGREETTPSACRPQDPLEDLLCKTVCDKVKLAWKDEFRAMRGLIQGIAVRIDTYEGKVLAEQARFREEVLQHVRQTNYGITTQQGITLVRDDCSYHGHGHNPFDIAADVDKGHARNTSLTERCNAPTQASGGRISACYADAEPDIVLPSCAANAHGVASKGIFTTVPADMSTFQRGFRNADVTAAAPPGSGAGPALQDSAPWLAGQAEGPVCTELAPTTNELSPPGKRQGEATSPQGSTENRTEDEESDDSIEKSFKMRATYHHEVRREALEEEQKMLMKFLPPRMASTVESWLHLEEPKRKGTVAALIQHRSFDALCTAVIFSNAVLAFFSTNFEVQNIGQTSALLTALDAVFLAFYSGEILLKLVCHRWYFFVNENMNWNFFDLFLVLSGLYSIQRVISGDSAGDGLSLTFLRMLRLLKLVRVLRMFRLMESLTPLKMILHAIAGSMFYLLWCVVMMMIIFFMFSLVFVQVTANKLAEGGSYMDDSIRVPLLENFGSVQKCMLGLFMATTGGQDWIVFYDALKPTGHGAPALFLFAIAFTQIALMNILTGIFVDNAIKLAAPEAVDIVRDQKKIHDKTLRELQAIAEGLDVDHDGFIDRDEFADQMSKPHSPLRVYLGTYGVQQEEGLRFYSVLKESNDHRPIAIDLFVGSLLKLSGHSQTLDFQFVNHEVQVMHRKINKLQHLSQAGLSPNDTQHRHTEKSSLWL